LKEIVLLQNQRLEVHDYDEPEKAATQTAGQQGKAGGDA
jgi:hypothetical protein